MRQLTIFAFVTIIFSLTYLPGGFEIGVPTASAQEIGFLEEYALATDREKVLKQLVPGTEDYYFYNCLHFQNSQQLSKVDEMLQPWIKRFGYTNQVNQIRYRQALLKYSDDPATTLKFLTDELNLNFNHQREIPQTQRDLSTAFDQGLIDADQLAAQAMSRYENTDGFTEQGLRILATKNLNKTQLRHLLERLRYPDFPNLVDLIVRDLQESDSRVFGEMEIHRSLTLAQLKELASKFPKVADQTNYVNLYLEKLYPSEDVNWQADVAEQQKYLDRMWGFVKDLNPAHNSLKANILFRKLELNLAEAKFDRELFIAYLKLPRNVGYINPVIMKNLANQSFLANLQQDFNQQIRLFPIQNDEPLVQDYLHHFLLDANDTQEFQPFIESKYLDRQFATVKILNGLGDKEKWASLLTPEQYQELMNRIDLDFLSTNPDQFETADAVKLELHLKNIKTLIVKVFEVNTENYYRKYNTEIDTNINLDGLVPNFEQTFKYTDEPALRIKRNFDFPQINKNGVYVIDFIAGGKSSRALIRKGRLQINGQTIAAGQLFTVLDQQGNLVKDASLWIAGRRYLPDENGNVLVPFSTQAGRVNAIIAQAEFSCLQTIDHVAENYQFNAAMVLDRESLTRSNKARILLRPSLRIAGGNAVPLGLLKEPKLVITTISQDDIPSAKIIPELKLSEAEETICEFVVPPRLKSIQLDFTAQIDNISRGDKDSVSASQSFAINEIDRSEVIQDLHLVPTEAGYFLEVLGKTGESRAKQPVRLFVKVHGFNESVDVDLQSDQSGRLDLGALKNVDSIKANLAGGSEKMWYLATEDQTLPLTINSLFGETITLAAPASLPTADRAAIALFEKRRGTFAADMFDSISVGGGLIQIKGLVPGDYLLRLNYVAATNQEGSKNVDIRVTEGKQTANVLVGQHRQLEKRGQRPLQISSLQAEQDKLTIELKNANKDTRVHLIANRYQPAFNAFGYFSQIRDIEPWIYRPSVRKSVYMQGRTIGDEYQYILDRKYAAKFPGNMLQRPSQLLNPWATQSTDNSSQGVAAGSEFGEAGNQSDNPSDRQQAGATGPAGNNDFANLDFLANGEVLIANLVPDDNGKLTIDREKLGTFQHIRVIALDAFSTCQRTVNLPVQSLKPRDGRLAHVLDADGHFSQSKQIEILKANQSLLIEDIVSAKFQYYDDLTDVFRLLITLNPNTELSKFEFILTWLDQNNEKKQELYSKHACHELNFFLAKKDPAFFSEVVVKHLQNKQDKTFIDHWLLNENLDTYVDPWKYARLNTVERILLSQRLEGRSADIVRNVNELYMLNPTPRAHFDVLYDTSIRGLSLDESSFDAHHFDDGAKDNLPILAMNDGAEGEVESGGRGATGRFWMAEDMPIASPMALPAPPGAAGAGGSVAMDKMDLGVQLVPKAESRSAALSLGRKKSAIRDELDLKEKSMAGREITGDFAVSLGERTLESDELFGNYDARRLSELRKTTESLYRRLPSTQEWMEINYYKLLPEQQTAELVSTNRFWRDYANHQGGTFLSPYFAEANRNFTEIMFALAVLDLPLKGPEQKQEYADNKMTFAAAGPTIAFHQQVENAIVERGNTTILVSENFFQKNDRYRFEEGVQFDKFISDEFHAQTLYGGQVVITNPTSTPRAVELLIQIPQGSVSCSGSQETKTTQIELEAFSTKTYEYSFYFPTAGQFTHYPAHVSADEKVLAIADPVSFVVTDQPKEADKTSWAYVSQNGTDADVIEFLNQQNVLRLELDKIAFRMKDKAFFQRTIETLRNRYVYNHLLWSYSINHRDVAAIGEFLSHADSVANNCGPIFESELLTLNPVDRNWYQHREYWPLVNARSHQLGPQRKILNPNFFNQYQALLSVLSHKRTLNDEDHLVVSYYMLLQDRIETALQQFDMTKADSLTGKIQYAYCDAYLDMYREKPESAAAKAAVWADYPVDHWRNRFKNILAQVEEIRSGQSVTVDKDNQTQKQTELASKAESFDFEVESGTVKINYQNVATVQVNFYEMDIELLFSRSPFAQDELDGFSMIRPNVSQNVAFKAADADKQTGKGMHELKIPDELKNKNILVEVVAGDQAKSQPYFANSLDVQTVENYGQLQVSEKASQKPISKTYVKVYAKDQNGTVSFYKDGYTDLRGRFDYVSQSNNPLDGTQKFSVLVLSEAHGAIIRQVDPPKE